MTEREKLLKQLWDLNLGTMDKSYSVLIDFILADRRRIVEPLIEYQNNILKYSGLIGWVAIDRKQREAIEETLNLSGVAEERK